MRMRWPPSLASNCQTEFWPIVFPWPDSHTRQHVLTVKGAKLQKIDASTGATDADAFAAELGFGLPAWIIASCHPMPEPDTRQHVLTVLTLHVLHVLMV